MNPINQTLNVLLIEDDEHDVYLTLRYLKKYWTAVNHLQADTRDKLNTALQTSWDIILCDFNLPDFDGMTALRMVREQGITTPLIILSGGVNENVASLMMRLGANAYVMKDHLEHLAPVICRELKYFTPAGPETTTDNSTEHAAGVRSTAPDRLLHLLVSEQNQAITERHKAVINLLFVTDFIQRQQAAVLEREGLTVPRLNILRILKKAFPQKLTIKQIKDEMVYKTTDLPRMIDKMNNEELLTLSTHKKIKEIAISVKGLEALKATNEHSDEMFLNENYLSESSASLINEALQNTLAQILR